eukprot:1159964-Pelagomonas_calceolata.AAC.6
MREGEKESERERERERGGGGGERERMSTATVSHLIISSSLTAVQLKKPPGSRAQNLSSLIQWVKPKDTRNAGHWPFGKEFMLKNAAHPSLNYTALQAMACCYLSMQKSVLQPSTSRESICEKLSSPTTALHLLGCTLK